MDFKERVAKYRESARQARMEAQRMTSAAAKSGLLKVAEEWEELAEDILKEYAAQK
jgi:hypothetical protein